MPQKLNPYLNFDGNCAEAMQFYASVFGTELKLMRFSESPMPATPGAENRVLHASLPISDGSLMASDTMPGMPLNQGSNVHLCVSFTDANEQTRVFEALGAGGTIAMPLSQQFFGRFGMLTDRFGIRWMVILEGQGAQ